MNQYNSVEDFSADEDFQDYVLDKSSANASKWHNYLAEFPEKKPLMDEAENVVRFFSPSVSSARPSLRESSNMLKKRANRKTLLTILLAVLIVGGIYMFWTSRGASAQGVETERLFTAVVQKTIALEDGTNVVMKPNSEILVVGNWEKERKVELKGDAFFDVERHVDKPFSISTNEGVVKVLGTSFTLNTSDNFEIILTEGKVAFIDKLNTQINMKAGEMLSKNDGAFSVKVVDTGLFNYWLQEKISFKEMRLSKIVSILHNSYNMNVTVLNEEILAKKITANFPKNDPELILEAIAEIYSIELTKKEGRYILE